MVRHWIVAWASVDDLAFQAELPKLSLPALQRWLAQGRCTAQVNDGPETLSLPHERALARQLGWPDEDGALPWASWQHGQPQPCAWLLPCHWEISLDHMVLRPPEMLGLTWEESRALRAAWTPWAAEDGLTLTETDRPDRWLACSPLLQGWRGPSLHRVAHRRLDPAWLGGGASPQAPALRRWLEEAIMLWRDHPVNRARAEHGQPVVNGLWIDGAGCCTAGPAYGEATVALRDDLTASAMRRDVDAWRRTWQRLDADLLAPALQAAQQDGQPRWLTLCGERGWRTWCVDPSTPPAPPRRRWWPWQRRAAAVPVVEPWWIGL
ncbi:phosphoglycerate mutase [Tepidimonas alkaliphilus]|nr:phosphoglycerate mutase [Tepidimonas alkaliphilus]